MRHSQFIRKLDYLIGGGLTLASLVMLFTAGHLMVSPGVDSQSLRTQAVKVTSEQCTTTLKAIGVPHTVDADIVHVNEASVRELPSLMERSSLVLQSCPGYQLTQFCAGEGCLPERGLQLSMRFQGS